MATPGKPPPMLTDPRAPPPHPATPLDPSPRRPTRGRRAARMVPALVLLAGAALAVAGPASAFSGRLAEVSATDTATSEGAPCAFAFSGGTIVGKA